MSGPPGLQEERTALAWQRTGLAGAGVGGLAVLTAAHLEAGLALGVVAAVVALVCGPAALVATRSGGDGRPGGTPWARLLVVAGSTAALGLVGAVLSLR